MEINKQVNNHKEIGLKWKPIAGFVLCIIITAFSLWVALYSGYTAKMLFFTLSITAFIQAILQLLRCEVNERRFG